MCACFCLAAELSPSPRMKKVLRVWEMPILGNGNENSITGLKRQLKRCRDFGKCPSFGVEMGILKLPLKASV